MEGLIPMVFRTIQRNRTRRHYQYLSSSSTTAAENATAQRYNIADFYTNGEYAMRNGQDAYGGEFNAEIDKVRHRRHKSFQADSKGAGFGFGSGFSPDQYHNASQQQSKKLVRFRSHRLFSCVSGTP